MKTRISALVCLLCVFGYSDLSRAGDPYVLSTEVPSMPAGTPELYMSVMAGVAFPFSEDATFQDGTKPTVVKDVKYQTKHSWGGSAGIWFPTRDKLWGFDVGMEITGYVWYPDVTRRDYFNNDPTGANNGGNPNNGTTTEVSGVYVGPNFLIRYPMMISEAYPNGRWHPYIGGGVGAHQMAMRVGGARGQTLDKVITDQRDTAIGFQGVAGVKAHLFKYVAAFVEGKYLYAHHNGLSSDRFGKSPPGSLGFDLPGPFMNPYSSNITTVLVHAGVSVHFNWEPDWAE